MKKRRLDTILIERGVAKDKQDAFVIVTEGRVTIDGQKAVTPAHLVAEGAVIAVREELPYVGRGAYKLAAALDAFPVEIAAKICADIGAATGGFTQILIERGAAKVYAIDTARGKLAFKIRQDPRVIVMEQTDVRDLASLPEPIDLAVIDISLISLRDILPAVRRFLKPEGPVVALFKPQYETRDPAMLRHGIVRDDETREALRDDFIAWAGKNKWRIAGAITSPIRGGKGNMEHLLYLTIADAANSAYT